MAVRKHTADVERERWSTVRVGVTRAMILTRIADRQERIDNVVIVCTNSARCNEYRHFSWCCVDLNNEREQSVEFSEGRSKAKTDAQRRQSRNYHGRTRLQKGSIVDGLASLLSLFFV